MSAPELSLVVPLLDEEVLLERATRALHAALAEEGRAFEIVLVDNGSRDRTPALVDGLAAALPEVRALHLPRNEGYGGGILAGMASARESALCGWHWGDGQIAPSVVVAAWRLARDGGHDLVKAHRTRREDGWERAWVSAAYHRLARLHPGVRTPDINGCPKLFRREAWARLAPRERGWLLDVEVVSGIEALGGRIGEVEAVMRPREGGRSHVHLATLGEFLLGLPRLRRVPRGPGVGAGAGPEPASP